MSKSVPAASFCSTLSASGAKSEEPPSSDRLRTKGVLPLEGERISSRGSPAEPVESGEFLQAEIRSGSGGQVRVEITSAIEVGWLSLGVGIGDESRDENGGHRFKANAPKREQTKKNERKGNEKE